MFQCVLLPCLTQDVRRRPPGPPHTPVNPVKEPKKFFGISEFGFTKPNELFNGRLAMLGFVAACIGEIVTGYGPLGQVAYWLGVQPDDEWYQKSKTVLMSWALFATGLSYLLGNYGQTKGDEQIY